MTLISPENDLALMAVLFVIAGAAFLAEKTRVGAHLTGAVIAILSAIAVANLRIIPHSAPAFDFVFSYFVPILIPLFLFKADLRHMVFETTRMTGAFLIASAGTVLGVVCRMIYGHGRPLMVVDDVVFMREIQSVEQLSRGVKDDQDGGKYRLVEGDPDRRQDSVFRRVGCRFLARLSQS